MAEEKTKKAPATRKKRTTDNSVETQALKKVLKAPVKKTSARRTTTKASAKAGTSKSRGGKKVAAPRRNWKRTIIGWLMALLMLSGVAFGGWRFWNSDMVQTRFVYMWEYQQDIVTYSEKNNVDPFLVAAIIKNESNFNHKAVSNVGAVGLMQIMPETGQWIAKQMGLKNYEDADLYKVQTNIRMGCWYVSELDNEFKHNLTLLMMAYNAGRGQTKEWMKENNWDYNFNEPKAIPYKETREYVIRVLHDRDRYYQLYRDKLKRK